MEQIKINDNVSLMYIENEKFKTNLITVYFKRPLLREQVTKNAILPYVLMSSTKNYKTPIELENKMQELYSSKINASISKMGEKQIVSFRLSFVSDRYLKEKITKQSIELLKEIIFNPNIVDDKFVKEYVDIEKESVAEDIKSIINNKDKYSYNKAISIMFENEPFSINSDGYIEDLENIDEKNLYQYYKEFISTSQIDIVVAGNFDKKEIIEDMKASFDINITPIKIEQEKLHIHNYIGIIEEKMDITQGKLVLGYTFDVPYDTKEYYHFLLYSDILGGGIYSKLFNVVREKHSLCYYINSFVHRYKGTMIIHSGIEHENKEKTVKLIQELMQDMIEGKITDKEIDSAKKYFYYSLEALDDSLSALSDFYYSQKLSTVPKEIEELRQIVDGITIQDIQKVAKKGKKDLEYFLTNIEKQ